LKNFSYGGIGAGGRFSPAAIPCQGGGPSFSWAGSKKKGTFLEKMWAGKVSVLIRGVSKTGSYGGLEA